MAVKGGQSSVRLLIRVHRMAILAFAAWLLSGVSATALAVELARGRPYTWSRSPNYAHCTDRGDTLQLTDGHLAANDYIWIDRATVGWELHIGDIVSCIFDLGSECALDSVVVRSAAFAPSEIVPPSLVVAMGNLPDRFDWAGALDSATLTPTGSARPTRVALVVPLHAARGRIVLIAALLRSNFLCTDEIEVYGTPASAREPAPVAAAAGARARAAAAFASPIGRAFGPAEIAAVSAAQRRLWAMRAALPGTVPVTPQAVDPVATEEAARFAARARSWRAAGVPALVVRRVDPWTPTTPWSAPQNEFSDTLELWPGAWGAAAIEIAAAADSTVQVDLKSAPAPSGAPRATLREVVHVESRDGRWAGDALPLAPAALVLSPGAVRQVWIDVDARNTAPGMYRLQIEVGARAVPLPVRVHDVKLSTSPLTTLDWTYPTKFALTRQVPETAVRDNRDHGIDSWCLPEGSVPWPDPAAIDDRGHITSPLDFTACDRELALLAATPVRRLLWYWDFAPRAEDPSRGRFRHPYLSPAWRRAVSDWLDAWLAHLELRGYDRARVTMQPVDEAASRAVQKLYRTLHELHPGLALALTLTRNASPSELRHLEPDLALAILERGVLSQNSKWIAGARRRGIEVWTYDGPAPSKAAPPVAGYRLLPWEAWAHGLAGCAFWAYGDTGMQSADAWNDFDDARWDFAVVYGEPGASRSLGGELLVPSKRWQAFRIGMDDTALLEAASRRDPGLQAAALASVQRVSAFDPDSERGRLLRLLD